MSRVNFSIVENGLNVLYGCQCRDTLKTNGLTGKKIDAIRTNMTRKIPYFFEHFSAPVRVLRGKYFHKKHQTSSPFDGAALRE